MGAKGSSRDLCGNRLKINAVVDACLMTAKVTMTLPIGADASCHWLDLLKRPSGWNRVPSGFAIGLFNPEELLATLGIAVLHQHFIFGDVEVLVDEMKREALKFPVLSKNRSHLIHAGKILLIERLTIMEILRIHPLHCHDS